MGCGIHCFVERRNKDGVWETLKMVADPIKLSDDPRERELDERDAWMLHINQNYFLFAILADVRNYWKSIEDDGCIVHPISKPKGLPIDVTERVKKISDDYGTDGHDHSYLNLAEITMYPWGQIRICEDNFSDAEWEDYQRYGDAETDIICRPSELLLSILTPEQKEIMSNAFVEYFTTKKTRVTYYTYAYSCKDFLHTKLPLLLSKAGEIDVGPEDIRMVFWFDN